MGECLCKETYEAGSGGRKVDPGEYLVKLIVTLDLDDGCSERPATSITGGGNCPSCLGHARSARHMSRKQ
jgi:hypothetical protein